MSHYEFTDGERDAIKAFLSHLVFIKSVRNTFATLYEAPSNAFILSQTAEEFFQYFNRILIDYMTLAYARLTDPYDEKHSNLTVEYLFKIKDWREPELSKLTSLHREISAFRKHVTYPRNKIIAHNDLNTYLEPGKTLGGFPEGRDREFMQNVETFLNTIHEQAFGTIFGEIVTTNQGDAIDLMRVLRTGAAAERILGEGKEKAAIRVILGQMEKLSEESKEKEGPSRE